MSKTDPYTISFSGALCICVLTSSALAVEPEINPGDTFTYKAGGKSFEQIFVGKTDNGEYKFQIGDKTFLMSATMSTISNTSGTNVKPDNGQLMLDPKKEPGKVQIGHKWEATYVVTKRGKNSDKTRSCTVDEFKPKKVTAGTYDAYLVRCTIKTKGKKGTVHTATWYEAKSLRILSHASGGSKNKLKTRSELVSIKR